MKDKGAAMRIAGRDVALKFKYIQPNSPTHRYSIVLDIDARESALIWYDAGLPPPNLTIANPENGRTHQIYLLKTPVRTTPDARIRPQVYCDAIESAYMQRINQFVEATGFHSRYGRSGADTGYVGLICKNPIHEHWITKSYNDAPYELDELAEYIPTTKGERKSRGGVDAYAENGRNCRLFTDARQWLIGAQRAAGYPDCNVLYEMTLNYALNANSALFRHHERGILGVNDVKSIARSISKYHYVNYTERGFSEWQSRNGKRSGESRRKGSLTEAKPWESLGISRATWYRKHKKN
jgi:hypothetical protein